MARMLDRLCRHGSWSPDGIKQPAAQYQQLFAQTTVIVADNVVKYFYEGTDQEMWDIEKDFPCLAPPFADFWMETRAPRWIISEAYGKRRWQEDRREIAAWGAHFLAMDSRREAIGAQLAACSDAEVLTNLQHQIAALEPTCAQLATEAQRRFPDQPDAARQWWQAQGVLGSLYRYMVLVEWRERLLREGKAALFASLPEQLGRWVVDLRLFIETPAKRIVGPVFAGQWATDAQGQVLAVPQMGPVFLMGLPPSHPAAQDVQQYRDAAASIKGTLIHPLLLAITFLHCKNVQLRENIISLKQQRQAKKKYGLPLVQYKTLDILALKEVLRTEGQRDTVGLKQALHICRGHFKDYRQSGLFGKHHGIFWWEQHLRGSAAVGTIEKDYRLTMPSTS